MLLERKRDPGRAKDDPSGMPAPPLSPLRKSSISKSSKGHKEDDSSVVSHRRPSRGFFSRSSKNRKQSSSSPSHSQIEREGSISTDGGGELMLSPTSSLISSSGNGSSGDLHFDSEESGQSISERITPGPRSSSRGGTSISSGISDQIHNLSIEDRSYKPITVAQHQLSPDLRRASLTRQYADWEITPTIEEDVIAGGLERTRRGLGETIADHDSSHDKSSVYSEPNAMQQIDSSTDTISETRSIETAPSSTTSEDGRTHTSLSSPSVSPKSKQKDPKRHSRVRGNVTDFKASLSASGFTKALLRMEAAGVQTMFRKLTEQNEEYVDEEPVDLAFEKRIWALVASQWLMFGKQLQCPSHEVLSEARVEDGRRILHLQGQLADGWILASKYPRTTVYSVSSKRFRVPNATTWPAPLNHHSLSTPSVRSPIPFPNHYFDCVISRGLASVCKTEELEGVVGEALRVLKPGGWLEVQTIDPTLTKAGDISRRWIESRVITPMENSNFSTKPAEKVLQAVTHQGLSEVRNARIALPVVATPANKPSIEDGRQLGGVGDVEAQRMMAALGKHCYEENYKDFVKAGHVGDGKPEWWWNSRAVQKECEREKDTCFALTLTFGRKL